MTPTFDVPLPQYDLASAQERFSSSSFSRELRNSLVFVNERYNSSGNSVEKHDLQTAYFKDVKRVKRANSNGQFIYKGIVYCSRSEAACAELMERYITDFKAIDGKTYQVPLDTNENGDTRTVDFLVRGVLFEYHHPRMWRKKSRYGDFQNRDEFREYKKRMQELDPSQRRHYKDETLERLSQNYRERRAALISKGSCYAGIASVVLSIRPPHSSCSKLRTSAGRRFACARRAAWAFCTT